MKLGLIGFVSSLCHNVILFFPHLFVWSLQTVYLQSHLGQPAKQTLPLKNAGNIDVHLRLKVLFLY